MDWEIRKCIAVGTIVLVSLGLFFGMIAAIAITNHARNIDLRIAKIHVCRYSENVESCLQAVKS